ncbi:midasin [Dendrothele bispora CBS 962.96]|uniref:Midasin n=1 Tax=Dendrothele bispora (strain CBS 962.96) TaxID=1314807 RepID=A0A4S8MJQ2_DENBC|nr:midasin [Dendrothele bispora CBS 962.96]
MATTGSCEFCDPLKFNLYGQLKSLLSTLPPHDPYIAAISDASSTSRLLAILSQALAAPAYTLCIANLFRPILFDLCARWIDKPDVSEDEFVALCLLVEVHEELFSILYQSFSKPSWTKGPLQNASNVDSIRIHRLLLAYYRILQTNREIPSVLSWSLFPLFHLTSDGNSDNPTKLLAIRCYALQSGMGEAEREKWEVETVGDIATVDCPLDYGANMNGTRCVVDCWLLPALEYQRVRDTRNRIISESMDYYSLNENDLPSTICPEDLCPLVANVHGVLLLRNSKARMSSPLVHTSTTAKALRSLALHLSLRLPILLTSPPSSGKSLYLAHLARTIHPDVSNQLIYIYLADTSLDPRSLLGSYVSSPTQPGTFEWKEGVLVRAMREGRWVVLKDIDRGSNEVLGLLKPLVESLGLGNWIGGCASLEVAGRGRVVAADSFAVFATRSVMPSKSGSFPNPTFFGTHKFHELTMSSPSLDDLKTIIDTRFPRLAGAAAVGLIRMWDAVRNLGSTASTRDVGLQELEKLCTRVEKLLAGFEQSMGISADVHIILPSVFINTTLREHIFLAARDVFFGGGVLTNAARTYFASVITTVAEHLSLDVERREWLLTRFTPDFDVEQDVNGQPTAVRAGQTRLLAKSTKIEIAPVTSRPFAMHRPAILLTSRIATAVSLGEPVLLTGETGTGKTSVITHLAHTLRQPLISLNLSQQTESSDLVGGFKPVDARIPAANLQDRFLELFGETFSRKKNEKFEEETKKVVFQGKWKRAVGLWKESIRLARDRIQSKKTEAENITPEELDSQTPRKRRKVVDLSSLNASALKWSSFERDVNDFNAQHVHGGGKFAFGFVEGPLVKALRAGDWILLDEINLASSETLECISGILHSPTASITLTEQGSLEPVPRHPNFRLFACMNPATDVGKKDLPANIRSRFTEIDVPPPDADRDTLLSIISKYIGSLAVGDKAVIMDIADYYLAVKQLSESRKIADGSNHRPHYSMRTLARALTFAGDIASTYGLRRAIWEGCLMAFTMVLDVASAEMVINLARAHLLSGVKNQKSILSREPSIPHGRTSDEFVKFGPFYLEKGFLPPDPVGEYIITPSVEAKLVDLARIIRTRRFPVLIEGPTSSGKTSSIEYLAKRTGHRFVRINNHEHTDIQEYLGSYVPDSITGKLVFSDGLLVRALRNGDWIVLDELNLAPTDVLEALNRLLDDNRELVIPETGEVVKPHTHFMLFATQNPPGLYAGRKVLSRAFRNRFLEVHFEDVPEAELETILCQRCEIAPSYGKKIVSVFRELQKRRQSGRVFESKHSFATLRDLFRWAGRDAIGYQELADNGYMLLAERARRDDDKTAVKEVIESIMGVRIDEDALYNLSNSQTDFPTFLGCPVPSSSNLIWTRAMQRLYILVSRALKFNEPVLLVGETGCGKTSVCQMFAEATRMQLLTLNCHQNTETADLIGGLRPVRDRGSLEASILHEAVPLFEELEISLASHDLDLLRSQTLTVLQSKSLKQDYRTRLIDLQRKLACIRSIFEWHDGPLVEAMRSGHVFLLDEISLADDSVLERLNSVLEPSRSLVLAEKGGNDPQQSLIYANDSFKLVATMNPGGDYGKKELSPALRNRFTEIWVPSVESRSDLHLIVESMWKHEPLTEYTNLVLDFVDSLVELTGDRSFINLRDILAWVSFSNCVYGGALTSKMPANEIFHHAAHMTYLDGLGSAPALSSYSQNALQELRERAISCLQKLVPIDDRRTFVPVCNPTTHFQFGPFAISRGPRESPSQAFNFQAPTTQNNAMRVIRACQLEKPILLEGSPGVGKTSLVTALAKISGHELCRINLSDQTDLIDLFGSDLPVEGGGPGEFAWKDGEFLKALQDGRWVLLDEMNLAPQAILEGLNAVLDHRGSVYIPELGRTFVKHPNFRIFAAQNPLSQGGGRKGLPKSFVNRFTKVYVEQLSPKDLLLVCQQLHPEIDKDILQGMISFNSTLNDAVSVRRLFGREGSPWEFNLRDILRWGKLLLSSCPSLHPMEHLRNVYLHRFRNREDRIQAQVLFDHIFRSSSNMARNPTWSLSSSQVYIGHFHAERNNTMPLTRSRRILQTQLSSLEAAGCCVSQSWLTIVTGRKNSGKTNLVRLLAGLTGNILREVSVNGATDTMDILGGFEQVDPRSGVAAISEELLSIVDQACRSRHPSVLDAREPYLTLRQSLSSKSLPEIVTLAYALINSLEEAGSFTGLGALRIRLDDVVGQADKSGRFEWVDGPLVRAMKEGYWLLLDDANLCSPSVLDRLNSLCEQDGFLTLGERGFVNGEVQTLRPHRGFRLFMTVDPQFGELSRAMRNRGIEIALLENPFSNDVSVLRDFHRLPADVACRGLTAAEFASIKRALSVQPTEFSSSTSTSGLALDHFSSLVTLIDHAPSILRRSEGPEEAEFHFLSRSIVPTTVPVFLRYLTVSNDRPGITSITSLCSKILTRAFSTASSFREEYAHGHEIPSNHILAQCMDFLLDNEYPRSSVRSKLHLEVLKVLQLVVALTLDDRPQRSFVRYLDSNGAGRERLHQILTGMDSLFSQINAAGTSVLESVSDETQISQEEDISSVLNLLKYTAHLRNSFTNDKVDFSAVKAVIEWIENESEAISTRFPSVKLCATTVKEFASPSTGLGLVEIWSAFRGNRGSVTAIEIDKLDQVAAAQKSTLAFRGQIFNLMTLASLPVGLTENYPADNMLEVLQTRTRDEQDPVVYEVSAVSLSLLITQLGFLARTERSVNEATKVCIRNLLRLFCQHPNATLKRIIPYQHLLWLSEANQDTLIRVQLQIEWMKSIWINDGQGPEVMFSPALLKSTISIWDWTHQSMLSLPDYEMAVNAQTKLIWINCEQDTSRVEQLKGLLCESLAKIVSCFATEPPEVFHSLPELLAFCRTISETALSRSLSSYFYPVFEENHPSWSSTDDITRIGLGWIAVSRVLLELFVPDVPVDPSSVQDCTTRLWHSEEISISAQISLHSQLEGFRTGNLDNEVIDYLRTRLAVVTQRIRDLPALSSSCRDVSRLHMFWSEVTQFQLHVLATSKIDGLLALLKTGDETASQREQVMQKSIEGFLQRLISAYPEFDDIIVPVQYALMHLRIGLRIVKQANHDTNADTNTTSVGLALTAFPSARSSDLLMSGLYTRSDKDMKAFQHVLLSIAALSLNKAIGVGTDSQISYLETSYEQGLRLWLIDQARDDEQDKASQSLYRQTSVNHDALTDAEIEEREFMELFPSFETVLSSEEPGSLTKNETSRFVSPEDMKQLLHIHIALFTQCSPKDALRVFHDIKLAILPTFLYSQHSILADNLDFMSLPLQLSLLNDRIKEVSVHADSKQKPYNFYVDPCISETKKAAAIVITIKQRLENLIQEWPEQMVLHNLRDRCEGFLTLDLRSPVAKILSALEQLLLQTEDWEMYANRENTLKINRAAMTELIVEWRRLELISWQGLLDSQASSFKTGVAQWWFQLYNTIVRGPLDAIQQNFDSSSSQKYLDSLIPLLDDFIRTSPLGQFELRMTLLHSFTSLCAHLAVGKSESAHTLLGRVRCIVDNTFKNFSLHSEAVASHLSSQRSVLETEVRNLIKLASWKDVNVYALKQSAQRTHHQLYRIIRKFRDVLRQPISDRFSSVPADVAESETLNFEFEEMLPLDVKTRFASPTSHTGQQIPQHLLHVERTFSRFQEILLKQIIPTIHSKSPYLVDDFAVQIILSSRELASFTIPSAITAEKREKQIKALLSRKRKAWSDLLKELKKAGFAARLKQEVLEQNANLRWIREQPVIDAKLVSYEKGEVYFRRLSGMLPILRDSLPMHHSDLTTRELQRGIVFLESGFALAVDARSRLAWLANSYSYLDRVLCRLKQLNSSSGIASFGDEILRQVIRIKDALSKLSFSLEEVKNVLQQIISLGIDPPINQEIVQGIEQAATTSLEFKRRLSAIVDAVSLSSFPILLQEEYSSILEALQYLDEVPNTIRRWTSIEGRLKAHLLSLLKWIESSKPGSPTLHDAAPLPQISSPDHLIDVCLAGVQTLLAKCPETESPSSDSEDDRDNYIKDDCHTVCETTALLKVDHLVERLNDLLILFASGGDDTNHKAALERTMPFLSLYTKLVETQLKSHAHWTKALFKLNYVLCSVLQTLCKQGFCKPPDANQEAESGDGTAEMTDGVGMGEGSGAENVSKDIQEESQVEGLQGDDANDNQPRGDDKDDDDAIEMSQDFGGEMEDVPDDGNERDDDDDGDDGESDAEPEEQLADLDASDPAAVDEKFWGDEKGPENSDDPEQKTNEDRSKESNGESDIVAKEGQKESKDKENKKEEDEQRDDDDGAPPQEAEDALPEEDGPDTDPDHPDASGAPMDEHVPDANALELPDDMDLGGDENDMDIDGEKDDGDDGEGVLESERMDDEPTRGDSPERDEPSEEPQNPDEEPQPEPEEEVQASAHAENNVEDEHEEPQEDKTAVAEPDISSGDGAPTSDKQPNVNSEESGEGGEAGTSSGMVGQTSTVQEDSEPREERMPSDTQPQKDAQDPSQVAGSAAAGSQQGPLPPQQSTNTQLANNPLRSLGDAMKEVQQRFDEILNGEERDVPREQAGTSGQASQMEYLRPEDADHDMQALGPAEEEQVASLDQLKLQDEQREEDAGVPMDVDPEPSEPSYELPPHQHSVPDADKTSKAEQKDIEGAIVRRDQPSSTYQESAMTRDSDLLKADVDMEEEQLSKDVEAELRTWQAAGLPDNGAEQIWRLYESLTHDLAYALCEQLRLILEPTLATRLKGDYRTGKRLNMKKIIPYIASDYTKDKIWLRRTRPSQREYQVLIALDDSRSMAESHSVHLAYQTLALVSKALSRLEAGDIGIAKFGQAVDVLHGFEGAPFSDQAGAEVMKAFKFNQKATNVLSLVETSLRVLELARERRGMSSATAADLWQLEIIISDGMCQDHDKLQTVLRKAEEQRVMIVFIIIDSLHSAAAPTSTSTPTTRQGGAVAQGSILSMEKAEFKNVNGKMELQLQRYLDSFPFEYYVVLRNVEALPEVLSATLKQFFERISEE